MAFTEDSRVKIPALLHFTRLGYEYISLKEAKWDESSNIFPDLFAKAMQRINSSPNPNEIAHTLRDITQDLENEDLGRAFYQRLLDPTGLRLIDFENFDNNSFHVVTELPCINDDEELRPDITLLINILRISPKGLSQFPFISDSELVPRTQQIAMPYKAPWRAICVYTIKDHYRGLPESMMFTICLPGCGEGQFGISSS